MSGEASGAEAYLYVISSRRLERAKIGVAGDAEKRLRELQVGSPVELKRRSSSPTSAAADRSELESRSERRSYSARR